MPELARPTSHQRDWAATLLSGILAIGFAAMFLSPLWLSGRPGPDKSPGLILGESLSKPLAVTVHVETPTRTERYSVQPQTGTLTEALARAAAAGGEEFTYTSRGSSIYVASFYGLPNARGGRWTVQLNSQAITDLSTVELLQGDAVFTHWESSRS